MPKTKAIASLSGMIDSDMEDEIQHNDVDMMSTPDSNQENIEPAKKGKGKAKAPASRVRKTKPASRRLSAGSSIAKAKAATKRKVAEKRVPLKEQVNEEQNGAMEEVEEHQNTTKNQNEQRDDIASEHESDVFAQPNKPLTKRGRPAAKDKQSIKVPVVEQSKATERDGEFEYTPTLTRQRKAAAKPTANKKNVVAEKRYISAEPLASRPVIPETQPISMEVDQPDILGEDENDEDALPQSVYRKSNHARATSKQPQPFIARKPASSDSDLEKAGNDPATRRKLGEMTKKLESLELRYKKLREVGIKEADANFEKLKKNSEERANGNFYPLECVLIVYLYPLAASDLIASLKEDLAAQKALAQESRNLRQELTTASASLATALTKQNQLASSLSESQNENKALQAKLAAHRSASSTVESVHANRTPGSALKAGKTNVRTIMVGSAEAAQAAQIAQLKEDLYSDLTGLILRGVDRGEDADIYDCIQTGRNGSTFSPFPWSLRNPCLS